MEANECGCLSQALTVAAMLSVETTLLPGRRFDAYVLFFPLLFFFCSSSVHFIFHSSCSNSGSSDENVGQATGFT